MDNRAVAPVVGKLLAAGITVVYIAGITSLLLGGVVPEYRTAAGGELGERVLATAGGTVERALHDARSPAEVRIQTGLPATIKNTQYRLEITNGTLRLDHPDDAFDRRSELTLPSGVSVTNGTWRSGSDLLVVVSGPPDDPELSLREATP